MRACRLILYSQELPDCFGYHKIFATEFETHVTGNQAEFLGKLRDLEADAVILCFCSGREEDVRVLLHLAALAGPVPVLACCKTYNPGFFHLAATRGVTQFLLCGIEVDKIRKFVVRAVRASGLRGFLKSYTFPRRGSSPHSAKVIHEIVHAFPHRLMVNQLSCRLGITTRRLQTVCRQTFGRSFTHLMRLVYVYHALTLMWNTSFDNAEIALRLNYGDESSLARIFRKELGYSPSEARKRLVHNTPEELLKNRAWEDRPC